MNIPIKELTKGSKNQKEIELLLIKAEKAFKTWKPIWSKFTSAPIKEEFIEILDKLTDLECTSDGGYPNSERHRICISRVPKKALPTEDLPPLKGISIKGNFLFDRAEKIDFQNVLESIGVSSCEIGDIWIHRDIGAQGICTPEASIRLHGAISMVRNVEVICEALEIEQLNLPINRCPRRLKTVEASKRLDAIASAGFGLSRGKIIRDIKSGKLRLNWRAINQASKTLKTGDKIQLEGKGCIEVLNIELTKRGRWRVELLRQ